VFVFFFKKKQFEHSVQTVFKREHAVFALNTQCSNCVQTVFRGKHSVLRHLAASAEVRQKMDNRTPNVGGIPGLTFNTDSNANAGKRIE
jgi:hypothetical protein